ncbi:MAG: glycine cleavage system protein GcvH [Candidatus Margulisbacteria bacterium]|nr:glycine cleavage system protein GcvH [Candidatus Margulisiibacteriota bacterium]
MTDQLPNNVKYSKDHEWAKVEGKTATVGISFFAQDQLGDIVYVELPAVGKELKAGEEFGVVESVKSVSSLLAPVSGKVVAINEELNNTAQLVNQDPYGKGWIIKIEMSAPDEANALLSDEDYKSLLETK